MEATQGTRKPLLIVLGALIFAILRSPVLLFHGRVIAEEGTIYFQQAWDSRLLDSLLAVHQGYFSLLMNGVTLFAAKFIPLEWVAFSFTTTALLVLLLTVYLAAICEQFYDTRTKVLAAAVCLLTPSIEVWLTLEDAQFYLVLCVALICISDENRHRVLRGATVLLAGLTGPCSCFLTPFFLYRAYVKRTVGAYVQAFILSMCALVQGAVILGSVSTGHRELSGPAKLAWFGPVLVLKIFSVTFFTRGGAFLAQRIVIGHPNAVVCILFWVLCLAFLAFFWKMARIGGQAARLCFGMALASLGLDYVGIAESIPVIFIGAFRYFFVGFALFWIVLVLAYARARTRNEPRNRKLALTVLSVALFCGMVDAVGYWQRFQRLDPRWSQQVSAWRANPDTPIRVCPSTWESAIHLRPR